MALIIIIYLRNYRKTPGKESIGWGDGKFLLNFFIFMKLNILLSSTQFLIAITDSST